MNINLKKIALFWGFISFLSGITSASPNTKICRKRNGNFPIPGTFCKGYYVCKNFVPVENSCADGEHFNPIKERCDWEELYPCFDKRKDKECLRENGLFLKPGTECKKYYRCCNGKAKEERCPGDSLFDPSKGNCEWPDLYTCIESLKTTEKVSSTVTSFATSTPGDQKEKTETDPITVEETTSSKQITYSTQDPDFEQTSSRISETTHKIITQPTPTDGLSTSESSETSTISETITSTIPNTPSTIEVSTKSEPTTTESTTLQSTTETSTLQPTTTEISFSESTTETSTLQSTTTEISFSESTTETSTLQTTSSEIISQTISPQMSSTQSTSHTFSKENKEGDITEPTLFETTREVTFSPSTEEVTPFDEQNIKCPEPNGHFPHPTDKHKFIVCSHNRPSVFTCPSNLVYKQRLRRCEYE